MYKIICVKHVSGEMNKIAYDNHKFFVFSDNESKSLVCGSNVEILKIKTKAFENVVSSRRLDPAAFPGNILVPLFDQYGNMVDFNVESSS